MEAKTLRREFLLFSFLGSQLLDLAVTLAVVPVMGIAAETNSLGRLLMSSTSIDSGILLVKLWALIWGWLIYKCNIWLTPWGLLIISAVYFLALGYFCIMVYVV